MLVIRRTHLSLFGLVFAVACGNTTNFEGATTDTSTEKFAGEPLEGDATRGSAPEPEQTADDSIGVKPSQSLPAVLPPLPPELQERQETPENDTLKEAEMTFKAAPYQEASLTFDQDYLEFSHTVLRESGFQGQTSTYEQLTRNSYTKTEQQGTSGKSAEEIFTQNDLGIIDILVVVDNSGSMGQEHNKIKEKLPELTSKVSGANWQIRVVSTDAGDACNQFSLVNEANKDDFQKHIEALGTDGSGRERGVYKAIKGLDCTDDPWIRNSSNLAVLIVSDEDNCSTTCGNEAQNTPAELKTLMGTAIGNSQTVRMVGVDARVYGIYHRPGEQCVSAAHEADEYDSLVTDTSGYAGSICDANYDLTFQTISQDMKNQLKSTFELANTPATDTLEVSVRETENGAYTPLELGVDFTLTDKTIEFINPPVASASIKASYLYDSAPKFNQIELGLEPGLIESVKITLENGDVQELGPDKYQVNGSLLVFTEEPADNSQVMVSYLDSVPALETSFAIAASIKEGSVMAKVNGQEAAFTLVDGSVVFDTTPSDGSNIEISYEVPYVGDIVNKITTTVDAQTISELKAWDEESGDPIAITLEDANFVLAAENLSEGQNVKIKYRLSAVDDLFSYDLPFTPSVDSIEIFLVDNADQRTECPVESFSIEEKSITLSCNIEDLSFVDIKFKYLVGGVQQFTTDFQNPDQATWAVWVNDKEVTSFVRVGNVVGLSDLPADATVRIKASYSNNPDDGEEGAATETAAL